VLGIFHVAVLFLGRWKSLFGVFTIIVLALDVEALDVVLQTRLFGLFLPDLLLVIAELLPLVTNQFGKVRQSKFWMLGT